MEVEGTFPWVWVVMEVSYNIYYFSTWFSSVTISSLDYFSSVGPSSKPSHYSLPLSLSCSTQCSRIFQGRRKMGKRALNSLRQGRISPDGRGRRNKIRVDSLIEVGCWVLGIDPIGIMS